MALLAVPGRITDRLLQVVEALQRLPVATTVPGVAASARVPVATARRTLAQLHEAGWVERERLYHLRRRTGQAPYGYRLSPAGRHTAAERFGTPTVHRTPGGSGSAASDETGA